MATNKKVTLDIVYEMLDQAIRPLADEIDLAWKLIYNDYDDDDVPACNLELSILCELAETVALEVETGKIKDDTAKISG